ncbi:hypothetical protein PV325_007335 [Microctonus aethiopoides]|nr:hypothetical protein PV325_007335 [Microctonus aethiopoides]
MCAKFLHEDIEIIQKEVKSWKNYLPSQTKFKNDFERVFGFSLNELLNFDDFVKLLYRPTDPASLGVARALFGLCMVLDVVEERGLSNIDLKWGDPYDCHFPLIHGMKPLSLPWMTIIYVLMWAGAFGIMFGLCFKLACACFVIPYWYIFLLDKSFWNNHTYLYGIIAILFWSTNANRYWAIDEKLSNEKNNSVPLWNYFIIKFQFFTLYFIAGLKKSSREWLEGYSMNNISDHWVFDPLKIFFTTEQTDFFIVHWFGFIFDLTIGFWMLFDKTRIPAMIFCTAFHLMNSRLFSIGMFPYVCLVTMPLFCHVDWPRKLIKNYRLLNSKWKRNITELSDDNKQTDPTINKDNTNDQSVKMKNTQVSFEKYLKKKISKEISKSPTKKQKFVVLLLIFHIALQFFLPYSHFITTGYNNWVQGLYGYSWDMMVHSWDTILIVIKVHDNINNEDHYIDPYAWVQNDRWSKHGDMIIQRAQCLKDNLLRRKEQVLMSSKNCNEIEQWSKLSSNLSIYIDVRSSLNGRFQQRVFNPNIDMLTVEWHPFKPVSFLIPLLTQFNSYRDEMNEITKHVYTWSNYTDVFFVADYPGMQLDNYFSDNFSNVSLTILEGEVTYSEDDWINEVTVMKGHSVNVTTGKLHQVKTISLHPSCYMYSYTNRTREYLEKKGIVHPPRKRSGFPIFKELKHRMNAWWRALGHIANAFFHFVYDVPMTRRVSRTHNNSKGY